MSTQSSKKMTTVLANNKGFTLIEMAIVLIIIGIIIGAVVKGKDVVKSAEQKRLYSTFIREWQVGYNNYFDRTGWVLGDDNSNGNTNRDGLCSDAGALASEANLVAQLGAVGLNPPADGPTGTSNVRTYTDNLGRQYTLTVVFANNAAFGNHLQITSPAGMPYDLGMAWDRIVDGTRDGDAGDFVYIPDVGAAPGVDANWPAATGTPPAASGAYLKLEF